MIEVEKKEKLIRLRNNEPPRFGFDRLYATAEDFSEFLLAVKEGKYDDFIQSDQD